MEWLTTKIILPSQIKVLSTDTCHLLNQHQFTLQYRKFWRNVLFHGKLILVLTARSHNILVIVPWNWAFNYWTLIFQKRKWSWLRDWIYLNATCLFPWDMSSTPILKIPMKAGCNLDSCRSSNAEKYTHNNVR